MIFPAILALISFLMTGSAAANPNKLTRLTRAARAAAALSGNLYSGILAALRCSTASWIRRSPITDMMTGLFCLMYDWNQGFSYGTSCVHGWCGKDHHNAVRPQDQLITLADRLQILWDLPQRACQPGFGCWQLRAGSMPSSSRVF